MGVGRSHFITTSELQNALAKFKRACMRERRARGREREIESERARDTVLRARLRAACAYREPRTRSE
jgi:hypothetical protein